MGTVTSDADASYAIIEDKNKKDQNLYRIGDTIQNATVKEIFRETVVLNVQGKDEVLQIEKLESRGASGSVRLVSRGKRSGDRRGDPRVQWVRMRRLPHGDPPLRRGER